MLIVFRAYVVMKRFVRFDVPWNLMDKKSPLPRAKNFTLTITLTNGMTSYYQKMRNKSNLRN